MSDVLWILGGLLLALHLVREYWLRRNLPQVQTGSFDGELYRVGQTYIARRPATAQPHKSIVCFPGFLEDMRYFQALYAAAGCELVLVNNANYHCAYPTDNARELDWPDNPHPAGSIEHDAFYLGLILRENWAELGPKLVGKIHLYCGDMDNYYLNNAVYLTEAFLESTTDPYYGGASGFERVFDLVEAASQALLQEIRQRHLG